MRAEREVLRIRGTDTQPHRTRGPKTAQKMVRAIAVPLLSSSFSQPPQPTHTLANMQTVASKCVQRRRGDRGTLAVLGGPPRPLCGPQAALCMLIEMMGRRGGSRAPASAHKRTPPPRTSPSP